MVLEDRLHCDADVAQHVRACNISNIEGLTGFLRIDYTVMQMSLNLFDLGFHT